MITQINRNSNYSKQKLALYALAYMLYICACSLAGQGIALLFHKYIFKNLLK